MTLDTVLAVFVGVGLAAACGLRVFVPLLALSVASKAGAVSLSDSMHWLGSTPALLALSCATALEIAAYKVPWLDHALDTVASPAAVVAGALVAASQLGQVQGLGDWGPMLTWGGAAIAGGGTAAAVQTATVSTRAASTATTAGLLNPVIGAAQSVGSVVLSAVMILAPVLGAVLLAVLAWVVWRVLRRVFVRRSPAQA